MSDKPKAPYLMSYDDVVCFFDTTQVQHPDGHRESLGQYLPKLFASKFADMAANLKTERDEYARKLYQRESENWKHVCASDVFQDLKHEKFRDIMTLLADGEISVGKAAEAIVERASGVEPFLPTVIYSEVDADLSWRERYDKLKASIETK
jgi:hypothetical protein